MLDEIRRDAPEEAEFVLCGRTPDELLPTLMETFARRYASLSSERVFEELNYLVKKGLGNAYKWGNGGDPGRTLTVRAVMTDLGAVVAIADEGAGFDVTNVLGRFLRHDTYSRHGGSGFFHFHESRSVVSYADGGRTLLIRFLCGAPSGAPAVEKTEPARARRPVHKGIAQLSQGTQVKVKGRLTSGGHFVAAKVSLKAAEAQASIDAMIQDVETSERRMRVLNSIVTLPEHVEIASPEQRHLEFSALDAGQVVELTGEYSPDRGFVPVKVQVRHDSASELEEIQGRIDEVRVDEGAFRVLGILVMTDHETEIKDKRPVAEVAR